MEFASFRRALLWHGWGGYCEHRSWLMDSGRLLVLALPEGGGIYCSGRHIGFLPPLRSNGSAGLKRSLGTLTWALRKSRGNLWNTKTASKVKAFKWRFVKVSLPTSDLRKSRNMWCYLSALLLMLMRIRGDTLWLIAEWHIVCGRIQMRSWLMSSSPTAPWIQNLVMLNLWYSEARGTSEASSHTMGHLVGSQARYTWWGIPKSAEHFHLHKQIHGRSIQ